jgi:hypothetical protein
MIKVWMLVLCLFSLSAFGSEFSRIRLNPQFEQYLTQAEKKSAPSQNAKSLSSSSPAVTMPIQLRSALLGVMPNPSHLKTKSNWTTPIPVDGEQSLLYEEIRRYLDAAHREIGLGQVNQLNRWNQQFNLGAQNFSGFSWQKPFGVVQIYADRQVTPNIFGSNWLIADSFTFEVEASTFLEKLNEAGLANMSAVEIGAFAGISFRRVYTYYHYAPSYQEGLVADFDKLFLPFVRFNRPGMERMQDEEIMKREDHWSARAGGLISSPPVYGVSLGGGVLAQYSYQRTTMAQSTFSANPAEQRYRINVLSKKATDIGASLELQLDFFKLLKLSLLRYDMNYEFGSGKEFNLVFSQNQWAQIKAEPEKAGEVRKILLGMGEVKHLEPYISRLDESSSESFQQRGSILIWGKLQKSKTEQIRVIKDEMVRVFFKNYSQSIKVVQNLWSRLFSAVIYKVFKFPVQAANAAMYNKHLAMEYEATHPQAADPSIARIEATEQFSFALTQSYDAARTDRWLDKKIKNDIIWFVDMYTTLPKDYKTIIRNEQLKGPMRVESIVRVEKAGFDYLLASPDDDVFERIATVCDSKKKNDWINAEKRQRMLKNLQIGAEECVKSIGLNFLSFKSDYQENFLKPSLKMFKNFLTKYYKKSEGLSDLTTLFGSDNVFINGRLQAKTSLGTTFVTSFSSGQFRGLGVIDNFKRAEGSRTPASIVSE